MIKVSRNDVIKAAYKKGYRVTPCGTYVEYKGKQRKLQTYVYLGKQYYRFSVAYNGKSYNILVHRLQAYQKFKGQAFKEGIVVRHKNDDSLNNAYTNITLGTQEQNMKDKIKNQKKREEDVHQLSTPF